MLDNRKKLTANRAATLAVLCAMALVTFAIESLFPPLFLPGAKMGLANVFSLFALLALGPVDAVIVVVVRITLGSLLTGNMSTLTYSLVAGLASVCVEIVLVRLSSVSVVSTSVASAVTHNVTQNLVFCAVSQTPQMLSYLPWLAVLGVVSGLIVGFGVFALIKTLPMSFFARLGAFAEGDKNEKHNGD